MKLINFSIRMCAGLINMWRGDGMDKIMAGLLSFMAISIISITVYCSFYVIDSWFVTEQNGRATVVNTNHTNAWVQVINTGKTTSTIYHPERWDSTLSIKGKKDTIQIRESLYNSLQKGDGLNVLFKEGRISSSIYITSIK